MQKILIIIIGVVAIAIILAGSAIWISLNSDDINHLTPEIAPPRECA